MLYCNECGQEMEKYIQIVDTEKATRLLTGEYVPIYLCKDCFRKEFVISE